MKQLLFDVPTLHDATSFYRGLHPLKFLQKRTKNLELTSHSTWNHATMVGHDAFFMQRPFTPNHLVKAQIAKDLHIPLWVDYDDFLLDVPTDNPTYKVYGKEKIKESVVSILKMADVVTVSTNFLKQAYAPYNKNIHIINNALNTDILRRPEFTPRHKLVTWRGSATHQRDVMTVAEVVIETMHDERFKEWIISFIGDNMWCVTDYTPHNRTFWSEAMDIILYHKHIIDTCPAVFIVPLHDSPFNRCKSNIAWLEATYAGAVTIAPKWEEWTRPGVINYSTQEEFKNCLHAVMSGEVDIPAKVAQSWADIQQNYTLSKTTQIRAAILRDLFEKSWVEKIYEF